MKDYSLVTEYIVDGDTITFWRSNKEPKKVVKVVNKKIPKKKVLVYVEIKKEIGRRLSGGNIK
mgnify:CR=1 FL=1